jgi:hypothetical protein
VVFIVLAAPLLLVQARSIARAEAAPARTLKEAASWSGALVSFVTPSQAHPVYGSMFSQPSDDGTPRVRSELSVALTIWALVIVAGIRMRRDGSRFWFIAAGMFLVLALGPYLRLTGTWATPVPLPYAALYWLVPPLRIARDPTRFFAIGLLMLGVVSAFGMRALLERLHGRLASILATAAIGALVIFEGLTAWPDKVAAERLIGPAYDVVADAAGEFGILDLSFDQAALLAQTRHGRPITAGRASSPRSAAASRMLGTERDFRNAAGTLALDPVTLEARLTAIRQEPDRLRLRFVIFATGDAAQVELAQRLGLRVVTIGNRVLCERL